MAFNTYIYFIYTQTPYDTVSNIEFFNPIHNLNTAVECSAHNSETIDAAIRIDVLPPQTTEMDEFYARLQLVNLKAAILSIVPGYSSLPPNIQDFAKPDYMDF